MDVNLNDKGIATVLKITSVSVTPNPVRVNAGYIVEVVIEQEHYHYVPYGDFEFEFSNESLEEDLINIGNLIYERTYDAPDTALEFVRCSIANGNPINLSYNSTSNSWRGNFTAPGVTSWFEENHVLPITIWSNDVEGNSVRIDDSDKEFGKILDLRVLDNTLPRIEFDWPTNLAYVTTSNPHLEFNLYDASPGINFESLKILIDDVPRECRIVTTENEDGSYFVSCITDAAIPNGNHRYAIQVSDYDGNMSTSVTRSFTLDTTAGNGETFNIDEMTFEWYRFKKLVQSGIRLWMEFDMNMLFPWMKSLPELGDHFFQVTNHHDDDEIVYKLKVEVKR